MLFAYTTISILFLLAVFTPKKIAGIEIYSTFFFAYWLGITCDIIFDLTYHLYGYVAEGAQLTSVCFITVIYFSVNTLFLNSFPYNKSILAKIVYILAWSIFATIYESIAVNTAFFYYNGWKLWYSAVLYPIIFTSLVLNLLWVRKLLFRYINREQSSM
ncbi:CBO0543 family protein [Bacillus seohaeanensis]|jgi:hypothetical protein|uniref:CBO0543 family protein n=1 Tax=Bacillus seohaeanensis TaxID=284580 RepID=A0ABW5RPA3_9BACI